MGRSKDRKLEYIREKNHYRLGGKGIIYIKVSNDFLKDKKAFSEFMAKESVYHLQQLKKRFNMNFGVNATIAKANLFEDDFINDTTTISISFKKI